MPVLSSELVDPHPAFRGYRKPEVRNYPVFHLVDQEHNEVIIRRVTYGAREYRSRQAGYWVCLGILEMI